MKNIKQDLDSVFKSNMTNDEVVNYVFKNYPLFTLTDAKRLVENERANVKHLIGYKADYKRYYKY